MRKVVFLPEVIQQFIELAEILYNKGYMSFLDSALEYSEELFREIESMLPLKVHRKAPKWFDRYGKKMSYAVFPKNDHTIWYIFFNVYELGEDQIYLVRFISNNHVVSHHLDLDN